ncbi:AAA family ATPase [Bremerella alba]|uniref:Protein CR006 P-loop domain-containing protein n=1 Tax=Bremerella alba TaxID=980252 RepID=A0A7V8V9C5_9BACT|nr:AAA family ATPase [Bremerella alba]MBA2117328.1 hypothetical protein [Bremerella alba]
MIEKIIRIKNVGKFVNSCQTIEAAKLTLIYGDNGAGKTTLCDILRSLSEGNPAYVEGRSSLGSSDSPDILIRLANDNFRFKNGQWSNAHADIVVFDKTFMHENVFAGDYVLHDHKRNAYNVLLGSDGRQLGEKVEKLAKEIVEKQRDLRSAEKVISARLPKGVSLSEFLAFEEDKEIDAKLSSKKSEVQQLEDAKSILDRRLLQTIGVPQIPDDFESFLASTLETLSNRAEESVRNHIDRCLPKGGEEWLQKGTSFSNGETCPFCDQPLAGIELFHAFKSYFSQEYVALKSSAARLHDLIAMEFGETAVARIEKVLGENALLADAWRKNAGFPKAIPPNLMKGVAPLMESTRLVLSSYSSRKSASPLEEIILGTDFRDAQKQWEEFVVKVREYNEDIKQVNALAQDTKDRLSTGNLREEQAALLKLEAQKLRFNEDVKKECEEYLRLKKEKETLDQKKDEAREKLNEFSNNICPEFEQAINQYLDAFGAEFTLEKTTPQYLGGNPSVSYYLGINGQRISLGDQKTPLEKPSFKNTLSMGDRSALAFSFFVAQLERDPDIANKIVVFDDPFTSQDEGRRTRTQQIILRLGRKAKQVIVLSHDARFLHYVWEKHNERDGDKSCFHVFRTKEGSELREFDIEKAVSSDWVMRYKQLLMYHDEHLGRPKDVVKDIRLFVEELLKITCPGTPLDGKTLGQVITDIRSAPQGSALAKWQDRIDELTDLNDFATDHHHVDASSSSELLTDTELRSWVRSALRLLHN